eukprot:GEMP01015545.1.p1 GENE.GEMP01015545.1~~GEMP01015545.1.p1  ORF type:complete len:393 (+),score=56.02 GEMP01015545.1:181-1359(+)
MRPGPHRLSGLLSRRPLASHGLKVDTEKECAKNTDGRAVSIRFVNNFSAMYELKEEVMASSHPGIYVRFARKLSSGASSKPSDVVIKIRNKLESFRGKRDERTWRINTEHFLAVPTFRNLAQIYEVLEDIECYYIVMEKLDGNDLFELLAHARSQLSSGAKLPWTKEDLGTHVCKELLLALSHLHRNGLIHKDLKLENVMLHPDTTDVIGSPTRQAVKLIDFDTLEEWEPLSPAAKDVLGTDQYIAPEAYSGNYSPKSDIFAVGVIVYKVLTSAYPYNENIFDDDPGENYVGSPKMNQIRGRLKVAEVDFERDPWPLMPEARKVVQKMLRYDVNERISVDEALKCKWMADALKSDEASKGGNNQHRTSEMVKTFENLDDKRIIVKKLAGYSM